MNFSCYLVHVWKQQEQKMNPSSSRNFFCFVSNVGTSGFCRCWPLSCVTCPYFFAHPILYSILGCELHFAWLHLIGWFSPVCVFSSDKESGERLSRLVEETCMLLADYSGRLAAEIDDRRQLTRLLALFLQSQRDGLAKNEQKLEVRKLPVSLSLLSHNVRHSHLRNLSLFLLVNCFSITLAFSCPLEGSTNSCMNMQKIFN